MKIEFLIISSDERIEANYYHDIINSDVLDEYGDDFWKIESIAHYLDGPTRS